MSETQETSEPVIVEWRGGLDNTQTVKVDPYAGEIIVNGRRFDIGTLCSQDVPDRMYQNSPKIIDQAENGTEADGDEQ